MALIRRAYVPDTVDLALFDPQIEVVDRSRPASGDGVYRGREGLRRYIEDWVESFGEFTLAPEGFIESGDKVVVCVRATGRARASGIELEDDCFHTIGFRKGKIASLEIHPRLAAAQLARTGREGRSDDQTHV